MKRYGLNDNFIPMLEDFFKQNGLPYRRDTVKGLPKLIVESKTGSFVDYDAAQQEIKSAVREATSKLVTFSIRDQFALSLSQKEIDSILSSRVSICQWLKIKDKDYLFIRDYPKAVAKLRYAYADAMIDASK